VFGIYFIALIILAAAVAAGGGYWYLAHRKQSKEIDEIVNDPSPLAFWTYTPQEWQQAVADEFSWGRVDGGEAQIRISKTGFYLSHGSQRRVFELETGPKVVTFAGYLGMEGNPLKLRVRWRVVTQDRYGNEEIKYHKEDYRIPVPLREKQSAQDVVDFFAARIEQNPGAYAQLVPDDEPISLFGKDSF
jgi:hypothetical protein